MRRVLSKNPLYFAFFFPALMDGILTLVGQDVSYWTSKVVNEASPAYYFLLISHWFFIIGSVVWFVFLYWIFKKLKEPVNLFLTFLFMVGHSWGGTSWVWKIMKQKGVYTPENQISVMLAWFLVILYFALIALVATYCLRIYTRKNNGKKRVF